MRKFIEYTVKLILIILVLLGYQALVRYGNSQAAASYQYVWWGYLSYAILVLSHLACGLIMAYNERKSGKAGVTKFVLFLIAIILVVYPFSYSNTAVIQNQPMFQELVRVLAFAFGILLTGIKL